jgi:hypothetical protein
MHEAGANTLEIISYRAFLTKPTPVGWQVTPEVPAQAELRPTRAGTPRLTDAKQIPREPVDQKTASHL